MNVNCKFGVSNAGRHRLIAATSALAISACCMTVSAWAQERTIDGGDVSLSDETLKGIQINNGNLNGTDLIIEQSSNVVGVKVTQGTATLVGGSITQKQPDGTTKKYVSGITVDTNGTEASVNVSNMKIDIDGGADSSGLYVTGKLATITGNDLTINLSAANAISGEPAAGLKAREGTISVSNSVITVSNDTVSQDDKYRAYGMLAAAKQGSSVITSEANTVITYGRRAYGAYAFTDENPSDPENMSEISLYGGSIETHGDIAYGVISAGGKSTLSTYGSLDIYTWGSGSHGAVATWGGVLDINDTSIVTDGENAAGLYVYDNRDAPVSVTGGTIQSNKSAGILLQNNAKISLTGTTVVSAGASLVSRFTASDQIQTITIGKGSVLTENNGRLLVVEREGEGADGEVTLRLEAGSTSSGDILDIGEKSDGGMSTVVLEAGAAWTGKMLGVDYFVSVGGGTSEFEDDSEISGDLKDEGGGSQFIFKGSAKIGGGVTGNGSSFSFGGPAEIGGSVTAKGSSFSFSQTGETTISGDVELNEGSSTSGGSIDNPIDVTGNVKVDPTSVMGGNWSITGDLTVDGTLSPGNSIGIVKVIEGDHIFGHASNYTVEINAAGESDRIFVGGTATLDGSLSVVPLDGPNDFLLGHPYTIVEADGGFDGTKFQEVTWNHDSAFLEPNLSYDDNTVSLSIDRNGVAFSAAAGTNNQFQVAQGIDSLDFGNEAHNAIALSSLEEAPGAFDLLSGEVHASVRSTLIEDSRHVRDTVMDRIRKAFEGTAPEETAGTGANIWTQAFTSSGEADADGNAAEVGSDVSGFLTGADGALDGSWQLGFAGGYSRTALDVDGRLSSASADSVHAAAYGGWSSGPLGIRFGAAHSWHSIDVERRVFIPDPAYEDFLTSGYDARTAQLFGEAGYRVTLGRMEVEPFAGLAYVNHHTGNMHELGGDAALDGASSSDDVGYSTLGIRGFTVVAISDTGSLTLRGMVGWQHAFGDVSPTATLAFTGSAPFAVAGVPIARDAALVELGGDLDFAGNVTLGALYSGRLGSDRRDHEIKANMKVAF